MPPLWPISHKKTLEKKKRLSIRSNRKPLLKYQNNYLACHHRWDVISNGQQIIFNGQHYGRQQGLHAEHVCAPICAHDARPPPFLSRVFQMAFHNDRAFSSRGRYLHAAFSFSTRGAPDQHYYRERVPALDILLFLQKPQHPKM